jgi:hypothetical protein
MSNNPFLKATNNRFQFLDQDLETDQGFRQKKDKKPISYDASNNSFTSQPNRQGITPSFYNRDRGHGFRKPEIIKPPPVKEFDISTEMFPEIQGSSNNKEETVITPVSNKTQFKDIITKVNPELNKLEENKIKPGWVEISRVKGKTIFKGGPLTPYLIHLQEQEELENEPNYIMNKAISQMTVNRNRYIQEYNFFHGEGAYEELYILPPVYGPEYDTDDEDDDTNSSDEYYDN